MNVLFYIEPRVNIILAFTLEQNKRRYVLMFTLFSENYTQGVNIARAQRQLFVRACEETLRKA